MKVGDEITVGGKTYTVTQTEPFVLAKGKGAGEYVILPSDGSEKAHDSRQAGLHTQLRG